jgi:2-aminobenzoate-CoA ligase
MPTLPVHPTANPSLSTAGLAGNQSSAKSAHVDCFVIDRMPAPNACARMHYDLPALQIAAHANAVVALLDDAVHTKGWANRPMLRSSRIVLSYADALERVNRIAQVLVQDCGLVPGNRVLLRGGNSIGMALAWLGVVKAGMVAVATMPLLRAKELGEILDKARPQLALCDAQLLDELNSACSAQASPCPIIVFNQMNAPGSLAVRSANKNGQFTACNTSADDPAMMAFTSGTTGKPKAAVHTHRDILAAGQAWPRHVLGLTPDDIVVGSPPLAFTFGLGGLLTFPMAYGASTYFSDVPYTPQSLVETITQVGATVCYTAPTFYRQAAAFAAGTKLPSLRTCVSAGEALPQATRQLWKASTGLDMLDGIGATEMFHIFISSRGDALPSSELGTPIGCVVPGYTAQVVDDAGQELPRGQVGKLAVTGPTGCKYLDDARQANYVRNGWNYPGDAFIQDEAGYFFYQSRADDMIITSGYNVGAPEVEDALMLHPAVVECAVVGKPDDERGMLVQAVVVLRTGHAADGAMAKTLQDHVKASIAPYKYPREVVFMAQLPRTETGKLQRFKLRNL